MWTKRDTKLMRRNENIDQEGGGTLKVVARWGIFITSPALGALPSLSRSLPWRLCGTNRSSDPAFHPNDPTGPTGKPPSANAIAGVRISDTVS